MMFVWIVLNMITAADNQVSSWVSRENSCFAMTHQKIVTFSLLMSFSHKIKWISSSGTYILCFSLTICSVPQTNRSSMPLPKLESTLYRQCMNVRPIQMVKLKCLMDKCIAELWCWLISHYNDVSTQPIFSIMTPLNFLLLIFNWIFMPSG